MDALTVATLGLVRFERTLPRAVANARTGWTTRAGLVLRIEDGRGTVGFGEASPLPGFSRETLGDCESALSRLEPRQLPPLRLDAPFPAALAKTMEGLAPLPNAARCALETALLDLAARRTAVPAAVLLGASRKASLPVAALLRPEPSGDWRPDATRALEEGFRTVKCKVGRTGLDDVELDHLRMLRRTIGPEIRLRLDANGSLLPDGLEDRLAQLAELAPEFVEEPVPWRALPTRRSTVPLALDESLLDGEAEALIGGSALVVVLKPMLLGGIGRTLALAERARTRGARVVLSHLFEGPVGFAAAASLALALAPDSLAAGLAPHEGLTGMPPSFGGATLRVPEATGLGVAGA